MVGQGGMPLQHISDDFGNLHQQLQSLQIDPHHNQQSPYQPAYPTQDAQQFQPFSPNTNFSSFPPSAGPPPQANFQQYPTYSYSHFGGPIWRDPRSEAGSPINPSAPAFGIWPSPPMSPHQAAAAAFSAHQSRHGSIDEFGVGAAAAAAAAAQNGYYGSNPTSTWTTPSMPSSYGFFPSYPHQQPQQPHQQHTPVTRPQGAPDQRSPAPVAQPFRKPNRTSWSGPSRPVPDTTSPDQTRERKVYHPQAPTGRSDWVMWVGNVPSNTSHEELWRYFNTTIPSGENESENEAEPWRGPSSIFLISRSSCAFVNLSSQTDLDRAVSFFNGKQLRPWDPRCPRMLCRVRRKDDDLRSGVGAQRGTGMHRDWVKEQAKTLPRQQSEKSIGSTSTNSVPPSPAILEHPPEGEGRRRDSIVKDDHDNDHRVDRIVGTHKSSGSFASTNSSFLARYFPRRYFILKSMTTRELEESVQNGTWRTQRHNEPILDQAYRTSQEVFLIFGANRSGEFFGYAKMVEPIDKEKAKKTQRTATLESSEVRPSYFLSPSQSHIASSSPGEITPNDEAKLEQHAVGARRTDPSDVRNRVIHDNKSIQSAPEYRAQTLDPKTLQSQQQQHHSYFPPVPLSAVKGEEIDEADHQQQLGGSSRRPSKDAEGILRKDTVLTPDEKDRREQEEAQDEFPEGGSGHLFRIEWIKVAALTFNRTRHLRNPWNADREVKVSRDGTELEPSIGAQLMAEFDKLDQPAPRQ
ncbi:hypothetical protein I317_06871 [Kwoniella heveanensis CBS 569]|nr:hypothetical protein I317_06871 [Kwoniella heveanensis CBS 569]